MSDSPSPTTHTHALPPPYHYPPPPPPPPPAARSPPLTSQPTPHDHRRPSSSSSRPTPASSSRSTLPPSPSDSPDPSLVSTAPSTPGPSFERSWRPTPNVPPHMRRRHGRRISPATGEEEEQNRWLSEDEGIGGSTRPVAGRRRRRSSPSLPSPPPRVDRPLGGGGGGGGGDDGDPGNDNPAGDPHDPKPPIAERAVQPTRTPKAGSSSPPRPPQRRAHSYTNGPPPSTLPNPLPTHTHTHTHTHTLPDPTSTHVGDVPAIQHLVQRSPTSIFPHLPKGVDRSSIDSDVSAGVKDIDLNRPGPSVSARLGDGPGEDDEHAVLQQRRDLVGRLKRILSCPFCPPVDGKQPPLHHPLTLPCGHTISAQHVHIPSPPPLMPASASPHDMHAAQQKQNQQRLALWAGVMCPIPTCKRYSPGAVIGSAVLATQSMDIGLDLPSAVSSGAQRGEMLASGVTYYPPPPLPDPPAYSPEPAPDEVTSPLLDISIDKILHLVDREIASLHEMDTSDQKRLSQLASRMGLGINTEMLPPSSPISRSASKRQRQTLREKTPDAWPFQRELSGVLECDVCAMLLYEPVTTPCQHSFCSKCLSRSLDHSSRCPVCRQDLPSFAFFQDHAVNKVLLTIIRTVFPAEYADRHAAIERDERDSRLDTPIFVCTLAFPGMPTILHVFEPRYRLMIRRCIESSSPRFGMVLPSRGGTNTPGVMEYGTMLEIQSVQMLPDGRSMVETVGTQRFKLLEKGNLDGYTVGRIEIIDDVPPEEDARLYQVAVASASQGQSVGPSDMSTVGHTGFTMPQGSLGGAGGLGGGVVARPTPTHPSAAQPPTAALPTASIAPANPEGQAEKTTEEYMAICRSFIDQLRSGSAPWLLQRLNHTYGSMPDDPSEFSYWMALVMPIDEYEKARLLPIRSPRLRLKLIVHWVESLRSSWWFSSG